MVVPAGSSGGNGIEIVIQAQNQADQVINQIEKGLAAIAASATGAQLNLADMGKVLSAGLSARGIDLTGGAVVKLGNQLVDLTGLLEAVQAEFSTLFSGAVIDASQLSSSFSVIQSAIPAEVKSLFDAAQSSLPTEFAAFQSAIANGLGSLSTDSIDNFLQTPIQRIQSKIDRLSQFTIAPPPVTDTTAPIAPANPLAPSLVQQSPSDIAAQLSLFAEAKLRIQQLQQEIIDLQNTPIKLQNELLQIQLDTTIPEDQKNSLVTSLQAQIAEAEQQLQAPIQRLTTAIGNTIVSTATTGVSGVTQTLISGISSVLTIIPPLINTISGIAVTFSTPIKDALFASIIDGAQEALNETQDLSDVLGSFAAVTVGAPVKGSFASGILSGIAPVANQVDTFVQNVVTKIQSIPAKIDEPLGAIGDAFTGIAGISEPLYLFEGITEGAGQAFGAIAKVGEQLTFFESGFQTLTSLVTSGPFDLLIGQNLRLNEQLLATKASLVATTSVIDGATGKAIEDPTKAIAALGPSVDAAIAKVRKGSEQLSGVTSSQLIETFQVVAQNSAQVGLNLDQSADTALSLAAAITTLGVPLDQARQEVNSILTAQISSDSVVAKSLGITNEMVQSYKAQGKVFDLLQGKLGAFRASNAIAANSIGGITSNIQEVFENIALGAGKPLLEPITKELDEVYQYLLKNRDAIQESVSGVAMRLFEGLKAAFDALQTVGGVLQGVFAQVPIYLFDSLANFLKIIAASAVSTVQALSPMINVFSQLFEAVGPLAGPFLQIATQAKVLQFGIQQLSGGFDLLSNILPGVGELMFFLNIRGQPLLNLFPALSGSLGQGAAGFLLLGEKMNAIPGLMSAVVGQFGLFGPLAPMIAGLIPSIAGVGITIAGVAKNFPPLDAALKSIFNTKPGDLINQIKTLGASIPGFSLFNGLLDAASARITQLAANQTLAEFATSQFKTAIQGAAIQLRNFVLSAGLLTAGLYLAFTAFDTFILKNEALVQTFKDVFEGIQAGIGALASIATNPFFVGLAATAAVAIAALNGLHIAILRLVGAQLAVWAGSAAGALGGLASFLNLLKFSSMAAGATQAAGGLTAISTAAAAGTLTFGTLATSIGATIAGLAALLLPITAVVAAVAVLGAAFQSMRLADSTSAVETYGQQTDVAFQSALQTAQKLKSAKAEQEERTKNGIKLTAEEYQANQKLLQQAEVQKKNLDDQIATLKEGKASAVGEENKAAIDAQIASLEKAKATLTALSQTVEIKPKELPKLGSVFEQLAEKARSAQEAINSSSGDPAIFKEKAKELIEITQQQVEQQQITAEEAQKRLGAIANNQFLDAETQIKAREAITASIKENTDDEVATRQAAQKKIEGDIAVGRISEEEGQKQITELRKQELELQIAAAEEAHKKRLALLEQEFAVTRATLAAKLAEQKTAAELAPEGKEKEAKQADVSATEKKIADQEAAYQNIRKSQEEDFNNERTKLQSDADKLDAESAKQAQEAKLKSVEKAQKAAQDATKSSENQRLIQTQELLNKGVITEEQAAEAKVKASQSAIAGELQAEEAKQAALSELIKSAATPKAREELEQQLRDSRLKTQDLTLKSLEGEKKAQEAHIATVKAAIEKQSTVEQIAIEKRINAGNATEAEGADLRADQKVKQIQAEMALEKAGSVNRLKLELELQKAIRAARDSEKTKQLEQIKIQQTKEQTEIEKQINAGNATEAEANDLRADQKLVALQKELSLEKTNKVRRVELELEIQKAIRAARESEVAKKLDAIKQEQTKEQIELEKGVNAGTTTEAQAQTLRARQKVQSIQAELALEGTTKQRRLELELELQTSLRSVREAELAERKAQLEQQNLAVQNQIQEQNQKIQQQADLFKIVSDAIDNRNRLMKAGADLAKASSDFVQAELNILSQGETSELRKRQLAQTTAAIRLQSLQQEQAFARESLALQEEQNRLKLEQEKIQNRIAQGEQQANIAKAQADIEVAKLDPKTTEPQRKALELKLQAELAKQSSLQQQGGLLEAKGQVDARVAQAERQKQAFEQRSQLRGAQAELARSLPPGQKQRAEAALRQQIAEDLGAKDYGDLRSKGVATAQAETKKQFGSTVVRPSFDAETFDVQQRFAQLNRNFGAAAVTASPSTAVAPGTQPLALPQADLSQLGVQFENSGSLFATGIDKLIGKLDTLALGGGGQNINVTLNTPSGSQKAIAQSGSTSAPSLENVVRFAKQLAGVS